MAFAATVTEADAARGAARTRTSPRAPARAYCRRAPFWRCRPRPAIAPLIDTPADALESFRVRVMRLTCIAGLSGLPQISIPVGTVAGCPVGLSFIGWAGGDEALLDLAVAALAILWIGGITGKRRNCRSSSDQAGRDQLGAVRKQAPTCSSDRQITRHRRRTLPSLESTRKNSCGTLDGISIVIRTPASDTSHKVHCRPRTIIRVDPNRAVFAMARRLALLDVGFLGFGETAWRSPGTSLHLRPTGSSRATARS